jgi:hypothetical protein
MGVHHIKWNQIHFSLRSRLMKSKWVECFQHTTDTFGNFNTSPETKTVMDYTVSIVGRLQAFLPTDVNGRVRQDTVLT